MFHQYDCFELARPIDGEVLPVGIIGVVLEVFDEETGVYEVEFVDKQGFNLGSKPTFTLTVASMRPLKG